MADYPIIFTLVHDLRFEEGAARVVTRGRALMVFEEGEWWCHGVEPGGLTAHGADPAAAYVAFKTAYGGILDDLAQDAKDFAAFEKAVGRFVHDKDEAEAERWERARSEIRVGKNVDEPFNALQRIVTEFEASVTVQVLRVFGAPGGETIGLAEAA